MNAPAQKRSHWDDVDLPQPPPLQATKSASHAVQMQNAAQANKSIVVSDSPSTYLLELTLCR